MLHDGAKALSEWATRKRLATLESLAGSEFTERAADI